MTFTTKQLQEKIEKLEKELETLDNSEFDEHRRMNLTRTITQERKRLFILQGLSNEQFDAVVHDMKIIKDHVDVVNQKYECRTVKFLCAVAEFFEKPRSKTIANSIRNYVLTKMNAPVCSITGNPKPALEPMPESRDRETPEEKMKQLLTTLKEIA